MTDNGAKALAELIGMHNMLSDGRCDCGDHDEWPMVRYFDDHLVDAILATGAVFLTAEEAERLRRIEAAARDVEYVYSPAADLHPDDPMAALRAALTEPSREAVQ